MTLILSAGSFLASPPSANAVGVGTIACGTSLFGSASSVLSSKVPVADSQVQGNTAAVKNIDCTWKGIAWQLAHTVLHSLTGSVVNWINSGFQGSPAFLTNPEGYFTNLADQLTGQFISDTGVLTALCSPFNIDVRLALALNQAGGSMGPAGRYTCTLGSIINNVKGASVNGMSINGFMNGDFSQGGWPAFIALSEPQNNEAGAYLQAHSDLLQQIGEKQNAVHADLQMGSGFLSFQQCDDTNTSAQASTNAMASIGQGNNNQTNPYQSQLDQANAQYNTDVNNQIGICSGTGAAATQACNAQVNIVNADSDRIDSLENQSNSWIANQVAQQYATSNAAGNSSNKTCQTVTPGSVISASLSKALGASTDELNMTNDINQVVNALFSQLLIKTLSGGLFGASQSTAGSSNLGSLTNQLIQDQQGQQNASSLQGQAAGQVQEDSSSVQEAVAYRTQIVTAVTTEQAKYQTVQACIANELATATSSNNRYAPNQNNNQNNNHYTNNQNSNLTPDYLQTELNSMNTAVSGINGQVSAAQTNLATASSTLLLYQQAAGDIAGASSLSQANDLSNQYASQLSTIPYNGAADAGLAYSDLNSTLAGIIVLDTNLQDYQSVCNGVMPAKTGH